MIDALDRKCQNERAPELDLHVWLHFVWTVWDALPFTQASHGVVDASSDRTPEDILVYSRRIEGRLRCPRRRCHKFIEFVGIAANECDCKRLRFQTIQSINSTRSTDYAFSIHLYLLRQSTKISTDKILILFRTDLLKRLILITLRTQFIAFEASWSFRFTLFSEVWAVSSQNE